MNPRDALAIAQAAIKWTRAEERRKAAAAEKRRAFAAYREDSNSFLTGTFRADMDAAQELSEAKKQQRKAEKVLLMACAKVRDTEIEDAGPRAVLPLLTDERTKP